MRIPALIAAFLAAAATARGADPEWMAFREYRTLRSVTAVGDSLWALSGDGWVRFDPASTKATAMPDPGTGGSGPAWAKVEWLRASPSGRLCALESGMRLWLRSEGQWSSHANTDKVVAAALANGIITVSDFACGDDGSAWAATSLGLLGFQNWKWERSSPADGDQVFPEAYEPSVGRVGLDRAGAVYVLRYGKIHQRTGSGWATAFDRSALNHGVDKPGEYSHAGDFAFAPDGSMWVSAGSHVYIRSPDGLSWERRAMREGLADGVYDSLGNMAGRILAFGDSGEAWVALGWGKRFVVFGKGPQKMVEPPAGFGDAYYYNYALARDSRGVMHLAGRKGLYRWDGSAWQSEPLGVGVPGVDNAHTLASTRNGNTFAATRDSTRLMRFDGKAWSRIGADMGFIQALAADGDSLWIATATGVSLLYGDSIRVPAGFPDPMALGNLAPPGADTLGGNITSLAKEDPGRIWFGTQTGLIRLADGIFTRVQEPESPGPGYWIVSVAAASGEVWAASFNALFRRRAGDWERVPRPDRERADRDGSAIAQVAIDSDGRAWVLQGGQAYRRDGEGWTLMYSTSHAIVPSGVRANSTPNRIAPDPAGGIWLGTETGLAHYDGSGWRLFTRGNSGLADDAVIGLDVDARGNLWIGTRTSIGAYRAGGLRLGDPVDAAAKRALEAALGGRIVPGSLLELGIKGAKAVLYAPDGRRVGTLIAAPGSTRLRWDGSDGRGHALPRGTWYYRLESPRRLP